MGRQTLRVRHAAKRGLGCRRMEFPCVVRCFVGLLFAANQKASLRLEHTHRGVALHHFNQLQAACSEERNLALKASLLEYRGIHFHS